jgi:hypothetical protein
MGDVVDIRGGNAATPKAPKKRSGHGGGSGHGACGAKTRGGGKCKKQKGWGTEHLGTGRCKLHGGSTASGQAAAAKEAAQIMGVALDVEPHDALLTCVRIAAGEVAYCSTQIAGLEKATEMTMFGEQLNVWIQVRQKATAQLAKYCKMALDAGVAERQVQVAERYGEMLATLISGILGDLKLTKGQQKQAPTIVRRHLQALEGGSQAA